MQAKRHDVPDLVRLYEQGEKARLVEALLSYEDKAEAVSQALWMAANLVNLGWADHHGLRSMAAAVVSDQAPRCRFCRGDERAVACECV